MNNKFSFICVIIVMTLIFGLFAIVIHRHTKNIEELAEILKNSPTIYFENGVLKIK